MMFFMGARDGKIRAEFYFSDLTGLKNNRFSEVMNASFLKFGETM